MSAPLKAPFAYFGGKSKAAPIVWKLLGDPAGYVEPFAGSAAVLLNRPEHKGRRTETLNDADGWLVNAWRSIQLSPAEVAKHAAGPITEIDYHARLAWLHKRRDDDLVSWLEGDPEAHDAKAAAWWLYVMACGIGDPFSGGPWHVVDGRLRKLPHLGDAGKGISRELPHLGSAGQGIGRKLPHLGDAGQGIGRDVQLRHYMETLATRLSSVRITCGDWQRVLRPSVHRAGAGGDGTRSIFLDPPYSVSGDLYAEKAGHETISAEVREWCIKAPQDLRMIICGYDDEHDELLKHGWKKTQGKAGGAGYSKDPGNADREKIWYNPACKPITEQLDLFGDAA